MPDRIDFNCDLGEGCGDDAAIVPWISSASIACGGHAGDEASMRETVALCLRHGVAIGASLVRGPGAFRPPRACARPGEVHALVLAQVRRLAVACEPKAPGCRHVKPHGALYNLAAQGSTPRAPSPTRGARSIADFACSRSRAPTSPLRVAAPACRSPRKRSPSAAMPPTAGWRPAASPGR